VSNIPPYACLAFFKSKYGLAFGPVIRIVGDFFFDIFITLCHSNEEGYVNLSPRNFVVKFRISTIIRSGLKHFIKQSLAKSDARIVWILNLRLSCFGVGSTFS
jgi:hypothetical protein